MIDNCVPEGNYLLIHELPTPTFSNKTLEELRIGTFENIETATEDTSIILALKKFVERRVSALPIVDNDGKLVNIYSKFDVIFFFNLFTWGSRHAEPLNDSNVFRRNLSFACDFVNCESFDTGVIECIQSEHCFHDKSAVLSGCSRSKINLDMVVCSVRSPPGPVDLSGVHSGIVRPLTGHNSDIRALKDIVNFIDSRYKSVERKLVSSKATPVSSTSTTLPGSAQYADNFADEIRN
ncbi:hypothetical protein TSAR_007903 [Trichomalopsis sarcophagae]|uniref:CBS domain-containing protein n=1 Tax=Trichomalopsis sarcophagae TaxID=543379 RepID=A0A232FLU5_9HYME|nr:hypothetical protein TSAR_007903 [Trichomalopsis sarcophagae]